MDHTACAPEAHDDSLPEHWEREEQKATPDGKIACNHDERPIAYCRNIEDWIHLTEPQEGCFLIAAWRPQKH